MSELGSIPNRIEIASLTDECYKRIKRDILFGKLGWGQRLNVINMARSYGISRSPVIKAIDRLAMEQLVCIVPNTGSFVLIPGAGDVKEVTEIRLMLETTMCRLAFNKNKSRLLDALQEVDAMIKGSAADAKRISFDAFLEYDRAFHMTIAGCADNERLRSYYESIRNQIELFRTRTYVEPNAKLAVDSHRGITEALKLDRVDEAVEILTTHVREVERETLESLEKSDVPREYRSTPTPA